MFEATPDLALLAGVLLGFVLPGLVIVMITGGLGVSAAISALVGPASAGTGVMSAFVVASISMLALAASLIISTFGLACLISGTVGLQVQRASVADIVSDRSRYRGYFHLLPLAFMVSLGIEAGFFIAPFAMFSPRSLSSALQIIPWLLIVAGLTWLCLVYLRFFSRRVLAAHVGPRPPKWQRRLLTLALSGLLCVMFVPLIFGRILIVFPQDQYRSGWMWFLTLSFAGALVFYLVIFGASWILVRLRALSSPANCPSCNRVTRQKYVVGKFCGYCGEDLAAWLFV